MPSRVSGILLCHGESFRLTTSNKSSIEQGHIPRRHRTARCIPLFVQMTELAHGDKDKIPSHASGLPPYILFCDVNPITQEWALDRKRGTDKHSTWQAYNKGNLPMGLESKPFKKIVIIVKSNLVLNATRLFIL